MQIEVSESQGSELPTKRNSNEFVQIDKLDTQMSTELTSDALSQSNNTISNNSSSKALVVKKKRIHKKKLKEVLFGFKTILRQSTLNLYDQQQYLEQFVFRQIPTQKVYFVAGDILVELAGTSDIDSSVIFNEFRNIVQVEKTQQAITFDVESVKPLKYLSEIIYYLENSQDEKYYEFAQYLKEHQKTVYLLQDQISQLKQNYLSSSIDLAQLIQDRKKFMLQEKRKFIEDLVSNDEFFCVGTLSISYENNTSTLSSMSIGRPTLALIGAEDEQIAHHFLRKGFIKIFNTTSRRKIFSCNMQFQMNRKEMLEIDIPGFEITTMDDLKIVCDCKIKSKQIKYPPHLMLQGNNCAVLNCFDSFLYIKYFITPQHLEQIIKIRSEYSKTSPQNKLFPENYDYKQDFELENFDYSMECQIFLEKYYNDMLKQMELEELQKEQREKEKLIKLQEEQILLEQQQQKQPCGYRFIQ